MCKKKVEWKIVTHRKERNCNLSAKYCKLVSCMLASFVLVLFVNFPISQQSNTFYVMLLHACSYHHFRNQCYRGKLFFRRNRAIRKKQPSIM